MVAAGAFPSRRAASLAAATEGANAQYAPDVEVGKLGAVGAGGLLVSLLFSHFKVDFKLILLGVHKLF